MSSTLTWKPVIEESNDLPDELKRVISRKLWDTDGSCGNGPVMVDKEILPYLEGLRDAGVKGADDLIAIILQYGQIELSHSY